MLQLLHFHPVFPTATTFLLIFQKGVLELRPGNPVEHGTQSTAFMMSGSSGTGGYDDREKDSPLML